MSRKHPSPRPASAVWLRWYRTQYRSAPSSPWTQGDLADFLRGYGYRCSARTVRRWERIGPPAWVRRVLEDGSR